MITPCDLALYMATIPAVSVVMGTCISADRAPWGAEVEMRAVKSAAAQMTNNAVGLIFVSCFSCVLFESVT